MPQQAIRFPDELHAAVKAEAERRGRPHTFSSVLLEWAEKGRALEAALSEAKGATNGEQGGPAPVPPRQGGVRPLASPRTHAVNCGCPVCKPGAKR